MSFESVFSKEEIYQIGKYLVEHGDWHQSHDGRNRLVIHLPKDEDLSSTGSRVDAVNRLIKKEHDNGAI